MKATLAQIAALNAFAIARFGADSELYTRVVEAGSMEKGDDPSTYTSMSQFEADHDYRSPFLALNIQDILGHKTVCGNSSGSFDQKWIDFAVLHGATVVAFAAHFNIDGNPSEGETTELDIAGGTFDLDLNAPLNDGWKALLGDDVVAHVESELAERSQEASIKTVAQILTDRCGLSWNLFENEGWTDAVSE